MSIVVESVSKSYGEVSALHDVHFTVARGTLTTLLGPSGCGKTTLLRAIAGLESIDHGSISLDGIDVTNRPVGERNIGFVFQHYALFPHLTVAENIAFSLTVRKSGKAAIARRVDELLALVQLEGFGARRPHQLSGGQRQRVALARALASEPAYLLLDEPFGALDLHVRRDLRRELRELHDRTHVTTVLVTHDADEAMEISDTIVVLRDGRVQQEGTPGAIYDRPANPFVMRFLGEVNTIENPAAPIFVRPADFRIETAPFASSIAAAVERVHDIGGSTHLGLALPGGDRITADITRRSASALAIRTGMTVYIEPTRRLTFPGDAS